MFTPAASKDQGDHGPQVGDNHGEAAGIGNTGFPESPAVGISDDEAARLDLREALPHVTRDSLRGLEDDPDVLLEVLDLFYGVDLPPVRPKTSAGRATQCWHFLGRRKESPEIDDAKDASLPQIKPLLQGINCRVRAGELVAVIGASGAGKSTFLDLLAGRKKEGVCGGEVLLDGEHPTSGGSRLNQWSSRSILDASKGIRKGRPPAYITQADHHAPELTVRENLEFATRVCMGGNSRDTDRRARVDELLGILRLESCADVRVGSPLVRGISGGQARRLSVGVGVIDLANVRFVLMDEPTTGLDSTSAMEVIQLARRLVSQEERRAIIATVHQPSREMFALFDKVLILVGGRQAFFGSAREAPTLLSRPHAGIVPAPGQNPAEFILHAAKSVVLGSPCSSSSEAGTRRGHSSSFPESFGTLARGYSYVGRGYRRAPPLSENGYQEALLECSWCPCAPRERVGDEEQSRTGQGCLQTWIRRLRGNDAVYAVGFWAQVRAIMGRAWLMQARNTDALWAIVAKNLLVGLLTASVFWQEGSLDRDDRLISKLTNDVTPDASNLMALLFFATLYGVTGHMQAIPDVFQWNVIMERERSSGSYSTTAYWLVSVVASLPILFGGFVLYLNICYWPLGLAMDAKKYFRFAAAGWLSTTLGYSVAQNMAAANSSPQAAFAAWPLFFAVVSNFAGFTVRLPNVRDWYRWLCEVSFCRWIYQFLVMNQFNDFVEGDELISLYFGDNLTSITGTGLIVIIFYVVSLILLWVFLQPPRSRLRVFGEVPMVVVTREEQLEDGIAGGNAEGTARWIGLSGKRLRIGGTDQEDAKAEEEGLAKRSPSYASLVDVAESVSRTAPLRLLEQDQEGGSSDSEDDLEASLRVPLLRAGTMAISQESILDAGSCEGTQLAFLDLNYYIFVRKLKRRSLLADEESEVAPSQAPAWSLVPATEPSKEGKRGFLSSFGVRRVERQEVHVLRGVTGMVCPGEIAGVLGPSGSGKTTLLDLLAGRKTPSSGRQEGEIIANGVRRVQGTKCSPSTIAYVMQDNVHHGSLTVRQTLDFAAKMRMPFWCTSEERARRVKSAVEMLRLDEVLNTKVGTEAKRGISGGEMKRLSIAVESIALPGLLVLDEPTSGLDAPTALDVMTAVRGLADLGRTVVVSLHQPSPEIFGLLDVCLLLTRGGSPAFSGRAKRAVAFFASISLRPPPSSRNDPASFLLAIASAADHSEVKACRSGAATSRGGGTSSVAHDDADYGRPEALAADAPVPMNKGSSSDSNGNGPDHAPCTSSLEGHNGSRQLPSSHGTSEAKSFSAGDIEAVVSAIDLDQTFRNSSEGEEVKRAAAKAIDDADLTARPSSAVQPLGSIEERIRSMVWLSSILTYRQTIMRFQNRSELMATIARHVFIGVFYGTLWWRLGTGKIYERTGVIFFSLVLVILGNQQVIPTIFQERLLFTRERGAGVYGATEYWVSIGLAPIPLSTLAICVYSVLVYILAGLNDSSAWKLAYFVLIMTISNLIGLSFCQMLATWTRLQNTAVAMFPVVLFFLVAFAGFIVRLPTLPSYLKGWASDLSFARWAMQGLVINEFRGHADAIFPVPPGIPLDPDEVCEIFLDAYGFGDGGRLMNIKTEIVLILLLNYVLIRLMTLVFAKYIRFERR